VETRSGTAIFLIVFVSVSIMSCASSGTDVVLPEKEQCQVFAAARQVLLDHFFGLRKLDENQGLLVSDYKSPPSATATARFYATIRITPGAEGPCLHVRIATETMAFTGMKLVWVEAGRNHGEEATEKMIIEDIRKCLGGSTGPQGNR